MRISGISKTRESCTFHLMNLLRRLVFNIKVGTLFILVPPVGCVSIFVTKRPMYRFVLDVGPGVGLIVCEGHEDLGVSSVVVSLSSVRVGTES